MRHGLVKLCNGIGSLTSLHLVFVSQYPLPADEPRAFLIVEFPHFEIPIMHEEAFYPTPHQGGASGGVTPMDLAVYRKQQQQASKKKKAMSAEYAAVLSEFDPMQVVPFLDYEDEADNPVEDKYRALAHDLLRGLVDPALKPDRAQRDRLAAIIDSTSHHPTREEKDLLWRFRFHLVDNRKALTKFLLAVDWTVDSEVVQAAELLEQWRYVGKILATTFIGFCFCVLNDCLAVCIRQKKESDRSYGRAQASREARCFSNDTRTNVCYRYTCCGARQ